MKREFIVSFSHPSGYASCLIQMDDGTLPTYEVISQYRDRLAKEIRKDSSSLVIMAVSEIGARQE